MKCPLLSAGEYTRGVSHPPTSCDCLKEECAWWDMDEAQCGFKGFLTELRMIKIFLNDIYKKMPHEHHYVK